MVPTGRVLLSLLENLTKCSAPVETAKSLKLYREDLDELLGQTAFSRSMSQNLNPAWKVTVVLKTFLRTYQEALTVPPTEKDAIVSIVGESSTRRNGASTLDRGKKENKKNESAEIRRKQILSSTDGRIWNEED